MVPQTFLLNLVNNRIEISFWVLSVELTEHMKEEHAIENFQEWNCDSCPFQANEAEELMNHLKATTHQPSPVIDKKNLYKEYKRCYTCDLEVDGYVNLMNHRKELHPSKKKCRNFPDDKFRWGKSAGMSKRKI